MILSKNSTSSIFDARGSHSYSKLNQDAQAIANRLFTHGASKTGERIAIFAEPSAEFIAAFVGTIWAGKCAVVLSPLHSKEESSYFIEDSGAVLILVSKVWKEKAKAFTSSIPIYSIEEWLDQTPSFKALPEFKLEAPALQLYTSGSTGKPKGAILTLGNLSTQQKLLREAWGITPNDTLLHLLPLHHMHGLCIALLTSLGAGASIRFIPQFEAKRVWEEMELSTVFMAVPTIYTKLLAAFDSADASIQQRWRTHAKSLRLATSGSAALPVSLAERWKTIAGSIPLERFGMTELGVALSNPLQAKDRRSGTVGLPLPSVDARIMSENANGVFSPSDSGELWVSGPSLFAGYYQSHGIQSSATNPFVELEGTRFFRTGDTVTRDEAGYFRILGRTSVDILKSGGYKLSALEIEEALREHPAIAEVAVIGMPDETWGDRVVAFVIARDGDFSDETALRDFSKSKMASYKVPKQFVFVKEFPRNALGKVIKPNLAKLLTPRKP